MPTDIILDEGFQSSFMAIFPSGHNVGAVIVFRKMARSRLLKNATATRTMSECESKRVTMTSNSVQSAKQSTGGSVSPRHSLHERFVGRLSINSELTPKMVSYRGNYNAPGFRWMKYKEGFSRQLIELILEDVQPKSVLDPFAGIGTTPLIAAGKGLQAVGIEIIPVGLLVGKAISLAANHLEPDLFTEAATHLLEHLSSDKQARPEFAFPHLRITEDAFPIETELLLARAREFLSGTHDPTVHTMLNLACMSVLESVSFTRKDGQYLRWDPRSGKRVKSRLKKRSILHFTDAISIRLNEMAEDIGELRESYGRGVPEFINGSSLALLRRFPTHSFDMVITSPPYANRYDYTRTYALELAWLGYGDKDIKELRQRMLSATVENKSKKTWLLEIYEDPTVLSSAIRMYEAQAAVQEVVAQLRQSLHELSNPHIVRMLEGYFLEMAVIVAELGRIVRPGGSVVMVNDNVQYHGEELPVDLILSDYAEQSGFSCKHIWTLPRGKGNSSQQMGRFGRREQRKCVFWWVRKND